MAAEKFTPSNILRTLRFLALRDVLNLEDVVFVDETGVQDVDVRRRYARAPGKRRATLAQQYVAKSGRVSFVGAMSVQGMLPCTMAFQGTMKGWLFDWWCVHMLLPCLRPGQTVVLDNASFHRKNTLAVILA